jgi:prepilin-type processing-associated H-X9-DG protein
MHTRHRTLRDARLRHGISRWEVVACGAVLFVLVMLILPAIQQSREAERRTYCRNNLKQFGTALQNYHESHQMFPLRTCCSPEPEFSWRVTLMVYLVAMPASHPWVIKSAAWDTSENIEKAGVELPLWQCLSASPSRDQLGRWYTAYNAVVGPNTFYPNSGVRRLGEITDEASSTIAVVESTGLQVVWIEPRDAHVNALAMKIEGGLRSGASSSAISSSPHVGGVHILMVDGSVRFLSQNISADVLSALLTVAGDEAVPRDF